MKNEKEKAKSNPIDKAKSMAEVLSNGGKVSK
jgi:hypothetical protein